MGAEYSILIPTWNNLALLQNCIRSIKKHSSRNFQLLVYVNEGKDGTAAWLEEEGIEFLTSERNVGICIAMNKLRSLVTSDIICYLNDDMYVLPNWDDTVLNEISRLDNDLFLFSSTMIEPNAEVNMCSINADFGSNLEAFDESKLLETYKSLTFTDWSGSSWPPLWMKASLWDKIEGFSEAFSPGMYSDPDMSMKAWQVGVRNYKGLAASRVYHFGSKSTRRSGMNEGRITFIKKWGITSRYFYKYYLSMGKPYTGPLKEPKHPLFGKLINRWKTLIN